MTAETIRMRLSAKEREVLDALPDPAESKRVDGHWISGYNLALALGRAQQGVHRTVGSLVRKGLAAKVQRGRVFVSVTEAGLAVRRAGPGEAW